MNKLKLLTTVAVAGLLGLSARASIPSGYSSVNIHLTVTLNTNSVTSGNKIVFRTTKVKVTNKEIMARVANEFDDSYPAGAQLVLNGGIFSGGSFSVLNKDGGVIRGNASSGGSDSYELFISNNNNDMVTGTEGQNTTTLNISTALEFFWQDAVASNFIDMFGPASVKDTFGPNNDPESFHFSGAEDAFLSGALDGNGLTTGSISGGGKDTANFD